MQTLCIVFIFLIFYKSETPAKAWKLKNIYKWKLNASFFLSLICLLWIHNLFCCEPMFFYYILLTDTVQGLSHCHFLQATRHVWRVWEAFRAHKSSCFKCKFHSTIYFSSFSARNWLFFSAVHILFYCVFPVSWLSLLLNTEGEVVYWCMI